MNELVVLDVAHGNCALIRSGNKCAVVDAPIGSLLLNTLEDLGVTVVEAAFVSHADSDHIAGIVSLLTSTTIKLKCLYLNPDSQKRSRIWQDLRVAVQVAERTNGTKIHTSLTTSLPGHVAIGDIRIAVIAPSAAFALGGAGSLNDAGKVISTNATSAILHVSHGENAGVLLAGDMEPATLDDMKKHCDGLLTETLVFPHHGGLPGSGDPSDFAGKLLDTVRPNFVVFSHGRRKHDNPRSEVISEVCKRGCTLACTQISKRCHSRPIERISHLEEHRAVGRELGECCGGSMTLNLEDSARRAFDFASAHSEFVAHSVDAPMCEKARAEDKG